MRPVAFALAALASALGSAALAQPASAPSEPQPPRHIVPEWRSRATGLDVERLYPESARRRGVNGIVMIECRVTAEGTMADCRVDQEAPQGEGFGQAALKMMPRFRMHTTTKDGLPVDGGIVRLPIQFRRLR